MITKNRLQNDAPSINGTLRDNFHSSCGLLNTMSPFLKRQRTSSGSSVDISQPADQLEQWCQENLQSEGNELWDSIIDNLYQETGNIKFEEFIESILNCSESSVKKQNTLLKWLYKYPKEINNILTFFCEPCSIPKKTLFDFKHRVSPNNESVKTEITLENVVSLGKQSSSIFDLYVQINFQHSNLNPTSQKYFIQYLSNNLKLGITNKHIFLVLLRLFTLSIQNLFDMQTNVFCVSNIILPFLEALNNSTPIMGVPFSFMKIPQVKEPNNANLENYICEVYEKGIRLQIHYCRDNGIFIMYNAHLKKCKNKHKILESECKQVFQAHEELKSLILDVNLEKNRCTILDIIYINGVYLSTDTYEHRRMEVEKFLKMISPSLFSLPDVVSSDLIYSSANHIMITNKDSIYECGKSSIHRVMINNNSLISSNTKTLKGVIMGYKYGSGRRRVGIGSLLIGIWSKCRTHFIPCTKVSGFSDTTRFELERLLEISSMKSVQNDFPNDCDIAVVPNIVIEVRFESMQPSMLYVVCLNSLSSQKGVSLKFPRFSKICYNESLDCIDSEESLYLHI